MSTSSTSSSHASDATKGNDEIKIAFDSSSLDKRSRITNSDKQKYLALDPRKDLVRWQQSTTDVEIFIRIPTNSSEKNGDIEVLLTHSSLGDTDELYFCLRKDKDIVWESIFEGDHAHRKLPHEILKDMVDADEGGKKKPYEDLSMESKILVEEMRERMRMLASKEISIEDLEGDKFVIGEV
ncbi:unnamed protein product [Bathycoccus prasinos]